MRLKDKIAIVIGSGQSPGEGLGNGRATGARVRRQQCFSCLRGQRARPRQMPRSASPKWAGRARRFKIEGLKYPIMKESDIMGALVEAEERTKVA